MMKHRLISLMSAVVMLLTLVVGCANTDATNPDGGADKVVENKAQMVVAMNPIFVYDDGEVVIAYNDLKNAAKLDYEGSTLSAMYNTTNWQWAYSKTDSWTLRATFALSRWTNGAGATVKNTHAYAFDDSGSLSLMPYSSKNLDLVTYDDAAVPDNGLLLSVSSGEHEGLCYTVGRDGILNLPTGTVTAVQAVGGVDTGFLAEDGTPRKAAVNIIVNSRTFWSGTLCNSTAGNGTAVTSLTYPQLTDIPVKAGDSVIISMELDAEPNKVEDMTPPSADDSVVSDPNDDSNVDVELPPAGSDDVVSDQPPVVVGETIPFIFNGYETRFVIVRGADASAEEIKVAADLRNRMEIALDAEVLLRNEQMPRQDYEIVVGHAPQFPVSTRLYKDLLNYRTNNADDYIIRCEGTKLYIVAANSVALQRAVDYFMTTYCINDESEIPSDLNVVNRDKKATLFVGNANIASFTIRTQRFPSYWETTTAEELHNYFIAQTGYALPIAKGGKATAHDICVGPQNNGVNVLWNSNETRFIGVEDSGYLKDAVQAYAVEVKGGHLIVNGGSSHAVNAAGQALQDIFKKTNTLASGFVANGSYEDAYTLTGGYGLSWAEEFAYNEGSDAANEKAIKKRWTISNDTTDGPTPLGNNQWDIQRRPGIYGENYWVEDGMLWEVTKWAPYGYDAVRLTTMNKMYFTFGILEVRMVAGTRNGACSSVWMSGEGLNQVMMPEIDVYENFGGDCFWHAALTWTDETHGGNRSHFGWGQKNVPAVYPEEGTHFYDSFHYIGLKWTSKELSFYIDGKCTYTHDITSAEYDALRNGQIIKLANGVGTQAYAGGRGFYDPYDCLEDVSTFYETQLVDYVRVYQLDRKDNVMKVR